MDISPRSFARRFFIRRPAYRSLLPKQHAGRAAVREKSSLPRSCIHIFFMGTSLPIMLADACRPGNNIDADKIKVPKTAQFCLTLDGDVERAA